MDTETRLRNLEERIERVENTIRDTQEWIKTTVAKMSKHPLFGQLLKTLR